MVVSFGLGGKGYTDGYGRGLGFVPRGLFHRVASRGDLLIPPFAKDAKDGALGVDNLNGTKVEV
jgi:hypothetical protein